MIDLALLLAVPFLYVRGLKRPELVLLGWLLLSPLSYNMLVVLGVDLRVISFDRLCLLISILTLYAHGELRNLFRPRFSKLEKAFLIFITVFLFEAVLHYSPRDAFSIWTNTLDCYIIPFYLFLFTRYLLTRNGAYDERLEGKIVLMLAIVGLYCAPMSVFEGLTSIDLMQGPGIDTLRLKGGDRPRANGPFWAPGVLGAYLSWTLLLVLYRWKLRHAADSVTRPVPKAITAPYSLLMVVGLYFVMFRNAWMGFLGGWLLRFVFTTRGRVALLLVSVLAYVGFELFGDSFVKSEVYEERVSNVENVYDRLGAWLYAFKAFSEHPLTGVGTGRLKYYIRYEQEYGEDLRVMDIPATYHPHNTILAYLAELGLLGVVPFCFILWYFVGEVRGCLRLARSPADVEFGIYAVSAAFAILAPGLTDRCFEWGKSNNFMYVIFGLIAAHHIKLREFESVESSEYSKVPLGVALPESVAMPHGLNR